MPKATWKLTTQESYINSSSKHKGAIQKTWKTQFFQHLAGRGSLSKTYCLTWLQMVQMLHWPLDLCLLRGGAAAAILLAKSLLACNSKVCAATSLVFWSSGTFMPSTSWWTMAIFTKLESLQLLTHQNGIRVAEDSTFSGWSKSFKALYGTMANFTFLKVTTWLFWSSLAFTKVPMGHKTSSPAAKAFLPHIPKKTIEKTKLALWNKRQIYRDIHTKTMLLLISQPRHNKALQDAGQKWGQNGKVRPSSNGPRTSFGGWLSTNHPGSKGKCNACKVFATLKDGITKKKAKC